MQPYDHRPSYDYSQPNGSHKPYLPDQFIPAKPPAQQQAHAGFPSYSNGVQISSQTPYGPHVPTIGSNNPPAPSGLSNSSSMNMTNGSNTAANGEEISTIFVVGFPEDMQEREFQNMFTFSQGFEAATLKIPNKEYTAYGSLIGAGPPGSNISNVNVLRGPGAFPYAGPNDPYNLVTANQGGVVIDGGRDGTTASWPAPQHLPLADELNVGAHFLGAGAGLGLGMGVGSNPNLPPRKQIIGFAKFRTREEALAARDALQGRRVDIEKGAVLKAEMAKKNLHTKRGVGPVPGAGAATQTQQQQQQHVNGLSVDAFNVDPSFPPVMPSQTSNRDSLQAQALSRLGSWQPQVLSDAAPAVNGSSRDEEERKRESLLSLGVANLSLVPGGVSPSIAPATSVAVLTSRSSRERVEEEEREQRRREAKDTERETHLMRLRASNPPAFDAFHSVSATSTSPNTNGVGATPISRQSSNASNISASGISPWMPNSAAPATESVTTTSPMLGEQETAQHTQKELAEVGEQRDESERAEPQAHGIVGPWDRINVRSAPESERSSSPPGQGIEAQQPSQQRHSVTYQPQFLHLHEQQQQAQQQLYHSSSQSESSETGSAMGAAELSSSSSHPAQNPIGYVGARLGFGGQGATSSFMAQNTFPRGAAPAFTPAQQQPIGAASMQRTPNAITSNSTSAPSSGSSAAGSVNGGNTSPQLPSPASANGTGSTTSVTSASGMNGSALSSGGSSIVRGTVDQNPPINTLYVGNLPTSPPPIGYPSDYLEETLREVFSVRPGYRKLCFRHKANGPMCFVEFEDVHYAAKALQEMSGNTLRGAVKNGIRLSYSKNPLGVRTPTSAGANQGGPTLQQQQQLTQTLNSHHFQQQYHHLHQQGQQGPPLTLTSSSTASGQDANFQSRLADDFHAPMGHRGILPSSILRRDSVLSPTSSSSQAQAQAAQPYLSSSGSSSGSGGNGGNNNGNNNPNSFLSSPPPRFYSTSPGSGMAFGTASSTPLTGASNAFVPRSAVNGAGGMFNGGNFGAYSPFAVPPHFSNESPFGQPPIPPHLQPLSIPSEQLQQQHNQQQQQGGPNDE
ncbi:hypothetical protein CPB84DRAFT_78272 [Gymnopilus junonius]|uniref:RRM domain-containing protein n=1 Tax=Gymnopilus junonius TaxID=109634 RepID=A0A9P5P564_GYMJU|nr:hypothetical protein CPB84DRAFT_78272 [Gymnopilus junonius]